MERELILPPDYEDYDWDIEDKGFFEHGSVRIGDRLVAVTFYDLARLQQEVSSDLDADRLFWAKRLLVVTTVNVENMRRAIERAPDDFFE